VEFTKTCMNRIIIRTSQTSAFVGHAFNYAAAAKNSFSPTFTQSPKNYEFPNWKL